jgi:ribonuclease T2
MNQPAPLPRSSLAAFGLALLLAACDKSPEFDHYVLALSWEPAFCQFHNDKPECGALGANDFAAGHLSVHGLWPNSGPSEGPTYCAVDAATQKLDQPQSWCEMPEPQLSDKTRAALEPAMPGVSSCLDRHEWIKHGTCTGVSADSYFATSVRLANAVQATKLGEVLEANVGRYVTPQQLINAFEASFGAGSSQALTLVCTQGGGLAYLSEVRIALKPDALKGALEHDDLYLKDGGEAGSCPDTIRVDSIGG